MNDDSWMSQVHKLDQRDRGTHESPLPILSKPKQPRTIGSLGFTTTHKAEWSTERPHKQQPQRQWTLQQVRSFGGCDMNSRSLGLSVQVWSLSCICCLSIVVLVTTHSIISDYHGKITMSRFYIHTHIYHQYVRARNSSVGNK
jgi:hypothetical protein